jgi:hypothetical protein
MFSTEFIFRQKENIVDNQKCQAGFRPLCNKIPLIDPTGLLCLILGLLALWKASIILKQLKLPYENLYLHRVLA